ncbi:MAG: SsrA-binding protein SmpB [Planctomycetota bacterium]
MKKRKTRSDEKKPKRFEVAGNSKARYRFTILETIEAGISLLGTEVKSLRTGNAQLHDAYARFKGSELWLIKCHIPEYSFGTDANHEPMRPRRLLLHKHELKRLKSQVDEKGLTVVPLSLYFNEDGRAKLELALGRGKKLVDKRDTIKSREAKRDIARASRR